MKLLKMLAQWVLKSEINKLEKNVKSNLELAKSLGDRLQKLKTVPPILTNGKDMSDIIMWRMDLILAGCLQEDTLSFPKGNIIVNSPIIVKESLKFKGEK